MATAKQGYPARNSTRTTSPSDGVAATHQVVIGESDDLELEPLTTITGPQLGAIRYVDDDALMQAAQAKAEAVRARIEAQGWSVQLRKEQPAYVKCEGWTALAAACGLVPTIVGTHNLDNGSRVAVAELRDALGRAYVRADAECGDELDGWRAKEPGYSKRSMAQTLAVGKCCRVAFSWVMTLAGYSATPYEEVAGRDVAEQKGASWEVDKLKSCIKTMRERASSIDAITMGLSADHPDHHKAAEAWFELSREEKIALWIAPSDGGPFTTEERKILKSKEFRELYYGSNDDE